MKSGYILHIRRIFTDFSTLKHAHTTRLEIMAHHAHYKIKIIMPDGVDQVISHGLSCDLLICMQQIVIDVSTANVY